jgi:hypothetical protein
MNVKKPELKTKRNSMLTGSLKDTKGGLKPILETKNQESTKAITVNKSKKY